MYCPELLRMYYQGDDKAKEIHLALLRKASEPFLQMLSSWLFHGELRDPYKEFMIQENRDGKM